MSFLKATVPFLALSVFYGIIVFQFSPNELVGDEGRHIMYAQNLTEGFFTESDNPELRNGPGYPIVLTQFLTMGENYLPMRLLNIVFVIIGLIYFKATTAMFTNKKNALLVTCLLGLYPPLVRYIPLVYSESLAFMLVCGLLYHTTALCKGRPQPGIHLGLAGICLAFLVLVKIIFLQVIGFASLLLLAGYLFTHSKKPLRLIGVVGTAFLLITPYLFYAYSLTNKPFYLGTAGGEILYHRSTPFENEWGNWFSRTDVLKGGDTDYRPDKVYENLCQLSDNHREVYLGLEPLTYIQQDSALKALAWKNMKNHPLKYVHNTISNVGRLFFHYPFSYRKHSMAMFGFMIPNSFILVTWLWCLVPFFRMRRKVPLELTGYMVFFLIYLCGIVLADGRGRNFVIAVPSFLIFITYILSKMVRLMPSKAV